MINKVTLLGSTGSIGTQCLDVCDGMGLRVAALSGGSNVRLLARQARRYRPELVAIADESCYRELKLLLADLDIRVAAGQEGVLEVAAYSGSDLVMNGIAGIAGLRPTMAAIDASKHIALANKESLVAGGSMVIDRAKEKGVRMIPVDSEHSAIFQCLQAGLLHDVRSIILTASGGPFFGKTEEELEDVDLSQAMRHPVWSMGQKITVDSATLMNKGLEIIEAMWLFDLKPEQVQVVVHRQGVVHSAVEFEDGAVIAQMGTPDMRGAIQYAFTYPRRMPVQGVKPLSLTDYGTLTFQQPDPETFLCLKACLKAAEVMGLAPCIANGASEAAVELFLREEISFLEIGEIVLGAVESLPSGGDVTLESIEQADMAARAYVAEYSKKRYAVSKG